MLIRISLGLALALALASPALAVGSSSSSDSPYSASSDDYDKAVQAVKAENYQRAVNLLKRVVRKDPGNADAWNYLGFGERNLKHYDRSLAAYRKALRIRPDHLGANEYLGELYLQTGKLDKANEQLRKLRELCPSGCAEYRELEEAIRDHGTSSGGAG